MKRTFKEKAEAVFVLVFLCLWCVLPACSSTQRAALAADEKAAVVALTKVSTAIKSGQTLAIVQGLSADALAIDPNSPLLQKVHATVTSSKTLDDQQKAGAVVDAGIVVLNAIAPK